MAPPPAPEPVRIGGFAPPALAGDAVAVVAAVAAERPAAAVAGELSLADTRARADGDDVARTAVRVAAALTSVTEKVSGRTV